MPRRVPSYRHHRPSGQAVVTLHGKDFYLGRYKSAESRQKYERLLSEFLANGRRVSEAVAPSVLTIAELLAAYFDFAEGYYSCDGRPSSEFTCLRDAARPVASLYGCSPASDFGPLALKAVRQVMIDHGLCRRHINHRVNRVRRIFRWGVENELAPPSVLEALRSVAPLKAGRTTARESEPVTAVPDVHVDPVLPHVARQVAAMIHLQRVTGMRPGEVVLMRPADIDRSGATWVYRPTRHKTAYRGHVREVYLGPQCQNVLMEWLDRPNHAYCFSPAEAEAERNAERRQRRETPMTPSHAKRQAKTVPKRPKRDRYDRDTYRRAIEYGIRKAKVPHWHPHQLRHSCATRVRREFGLDVAQVILGHKSAAISEVYAEVDRAKAVQVMSQFG